MGRQVYISDKHHKKLKMAAAETDKNMGELVEKHIDRMEVTGWNEVKEAKYS